MAVTVHLKWFCHESWKSREKSAEICFRSNIARSLYQKLLWQNRKTFYVLNSWKENILGLLKMLQFIFIHTHAPVCICLFTFYPNTHPNLSKDILHFIFCFLNDWKYLKFNLRLSGCMCVQENLFQGLLSWLIDFSSFKLQ